MLALEHIKVLDLAHLAPGAYCTMILADLGAEVIKCEALPSAGGRGASIGLSPTGEEGRRKAAFNAVNRNKKSIGLNLRSEAGKEVFYKLAKTADVIIEGFRPGAVKRLGVDYESIKKLNPRIVYCSLSGFGQDGPYSQLPGHDINYISTAGVLGIIGKADEPPVAPLNILADFAGASLQGAIGILTALVAREKTGKGQYVDISCTDTSLSLITWGVMSRYFETGVPMRRGTTALQSAYPYYGVYKCKDGKYISIGALEAWFWENLCRAVGKEEYIKDCFSLDHYAHGPQVPRWQEIRESFDKLFLTKTRDEWFDLLTKHDVPIGKIYELEEVADDPQIKHRNMVVDIDDPKVGKVRQVGIAIKLSDTPGKIRSLSPLLGQNTDEVLLETGYTKVQIEELRQANAIG